MSEEEFDFFKAFHGVDIFAVESTSIIIGRAVAALHKGMVGGGLSDDQATAIIMDALKVVIIGSGLFG